MKWGVPVTETSDWILDHPDSGLVQRMDSGKSTATFHQNNLDLKFILVPC